MKRVTSNLWSAYRRAWPLAAILAAVAIFFYPVWIQNKTPLPADFMVGTYYPWLDYKWSGFPAGVPVKNPITTDVISFIYPMRIYAVELMKRGLAPLWNPLILSGTPILANFQSAPFSPTNIFYFFLPKLDAWSWQIIFQPILAITFLFFLLREFGRSKLASLAGGIFFAFAGFCVIWLEWNAHSLVAAFFPLIFFLVIKWLKSGRLIWGILLSFSLALQIFSGYPQIIIYQFLALILLVLFFDRQLFKTGKMVGLIIFLGLGMGLAAIQILPGLELLKLSQRRFEQVINVSAFLPLEMLITIVAPDFFGNHVTKNWWGPGDYTLVTGYSGVVTTMLASFGLISAFRQKYVKFGLSLVILSLAIAFGNPLSGWARDSGFLGLQAASAHRALVLSNLGFAILAAFGIDYFLENRLKFKDVIRSLYFPGILILSFGSAILFIDKFYTLPSVYDANLKVAVRNLVLPGIVLIIAVALFFLSARLGKKQKFVTLIILLGVLELFRFGWKFTPFSPKDLVFPETPVIEFLQHQQKPFRVTAEDVIPINLLMPYGIQVAEGYDAIYSLRYAEFLAALNSNSAGAEPMGRYGSINNLDSPLIDILNVKYILAKKQDKSGKITPEGELPLKFQKEYFEKVFEDKSVVILENKRVSDRVKQYYDFEIVSDDREILNRMLDKSYPLSQTIILEKNPANLLGAGMGGVSFNEEGANKIIDVESNKPGIIFISDSWYPGWRAYVDGTEKEILRADYNFMAVVLEAGKKKIKMEYKPDSFERGKRISIVSLIILLVLLIRRQQKGVYAGSKKSSGDS